jgi:lipoprotein-releasing system permease protein
MARTIYQVFRGLFAWVNLQEAIIPIVIAIMIVVAAFNIVGTLLMIILEKTREIGVMASMGASRQVLRRLFLWLGLFIGAAGTGIGLSLAFGLAVLQQRYAIIPLPAEAYYMDTAPVELDPFDFVLVGVVALILCVLAAYIPARFASRIEPLKVIRFS